MNEVFIIWDRINNCSQIFYRPKWSDVKTKDVAQIQKNRMTKVRIGRNMQT